MEIEEIHEFDLTDRVEAEIAALLETVFGAGDGYGGRSFYNQRPHWRVIARAHGQMVGHIGLWLRDIGLGGVRHAMAGVGDVATHPAHRRIGIGSALLSAAIARAERSPAQFMLLFGTRGLYGGHGFRSANNMIRVVDCIDGQTGAVVERPSRALMVRQIGDRPWDDTTVLDLLGMPF